MRVRIPKLVRMKASTSFPEMWGRISNDEVFGLERIFERVTGEELVVLYEEGDGRWPRMHEIIRALEKAVTALNYILGAERFWLQAPRSYDEVIDVAHAATEIEEHPERWAAQDSLLARVLSLLARDFISTLVMDAQPPRSMPFDWMFVLDFELQSPPPVAAAEHFDVFISYKHATYSADAMLLYAQLTALGVRCWLDREVLQVQPGEWVEPAALKAMLKQGLKNSDLTVSFETYDQAHGDEDHRGSSTAFNYQAFEWRHASHLAYVERGGTLNVPELGRRVPFQGPTGLAEEVAKLWRALHGTPPRRETLWSSPDPSLAPALSALHGLVREYFGREIHVTPDAALALLTAGRVEQNGGEFATFADDVLLAAVRHDPGCAVALARAGVDLQALFDVGARLRRTRWKSPGSFVLKDCLGHGHMRRAARADEIARAGRMTAADVMCAILQNAAAHPTVARELLQRVYRRAYDGLAPEQAMDFVERAAASVETAMEGALQPRGVRWALYDDGGTLRFDPISVCDACRMEGVDADGAVPVAVCVTHRDEVFTTPSGDTPPISLQGGALEAYFERHPEMQVLLADASTRLTTLYEPAGSARGALRFFLEPLTQPAPAGDELQAEGGMARVLAGAQRLERERGQDAPAASSGLIPHRAIVFGEWSAAGAAEAYPLHTPLSAVLAIGPAVELHRRVVEMEYDDF
jgi:hypothetical protein